MKVFGNLISIQRGEEFTIDFTLVNKDNTPYIVPLQLPAPYVLITVGSNSFNTENAYVLNQWCDLTHSPRFQSTAIEAYIDENTPEHYYDDGNTSILGEGSGAVTYYNKCVFYNSDDGKYYYYTAEHGYVEYSFSIRVAFSTEITSEWWAQQYTYDITLVSDAELNPSAASESDYSDKITTRIPILTGGTITVGNQIGG